MDGGSDAVLEGDEFAVGVEVEAHSRAVGDRRPYLGELSLGGSVTVAGAGLVAMLPVYTHAWAAEIVAVPVALLLAAVYLRVWAGPGSPRGDRPARRRRLAALALPRRL
ncbi:hypothetical protein J0670_09250 [Streptomyces sp. FH025]|nr:hypothetical protein [Streptomyces sp. FH025]MBO1414787.1 hypothetical protein [Streptomyces sp. FH025]